MIKDGQVRKLRSLLDAGSALSAAARRIGMDEKTARKYRDSDSLPSEMVQPRTYRTRIDPFANVWPKVQQRLEAEPKLRPFTLFGWLQEAYPGEFPDSQRRTFERRVRAWRAKNGPNQEVMFPQNHHPAQLGASDFTHMKELRVTIAGQPFEHMLYHFTLTYSNWEAVSICFSESFEALSRGLQDALWKLGGVPRKHRTDSLSAAVNNLSSDREFRARYCDLLKHYRMEPHRTNVGKGHENGDVESSHGHLKTVVEQALLLRGSRDFASREEYESFLAQLIDRRNANRVDKLAEEQPHLDELPPDRVPYHTTLGNIRVSKSSTIQVKRNTYSVHSRLIGHRVDVVINADSIVVRHGDTEVQTMPRLIGSGKHAINYRHVIDSLVRKPGAFANYKYREDMFPTSHFRIAFDALCDKHTEKVATREYLKILQLAAKESQDAVQDALRVAIAGGLKISFDAIKQAVAKHQQLPAATNVTIEQPDLQEFDSLLKHPLLPSDHAQTDKEVNHEHQHEISKEISNEEISAQTTTDSQQEQHRVNEENSGEENEAKRGGGKEGSNNDRGSESGAANASNRANANEPQDDQCGDAHFAEAIDNGTDGAIPRPSHADVPRTLRGSGGESDTGIAESHRVPERTDAPRMSGSPRKPDCSAVAPIATAEDKDLGELRLETPATTSDSAARKPPRRSVPRPPRKPFAVWEAGFGEEPLSFRVGRSTGLAGAFGFIHNVQLVGAAVVGCQT